MRGGGAVRVAIGNAARCGCGRRGAGLRLAVAKVDVRGWRGASASVAHAADRCAARRVYGGSVRDLLTRWLTESLSKARATSWLASRKTLENSALRPRITPTGGQESLLHQVPSAETVGTRRAAARAASRSNAVDQHRHSQGDVSPTAPKKKRNNKLHTRLAALRRRQLVL